MSADRSCMLGGHVPKHAECFVRALQQRFDDAAAMFKPGEMQAHKATSAQLQRIATRIGGFPTMRNALSLPDGATLKFALPSDARRFLQSNRFHQVAYTTTAVDGQPVFYVLALDGGVAPQRVLWVEVHLPTPDAAARQRAGQALADLLR